MGHGPLPKTLTRPFDLRSSRGLASLEATADPKGGWLRGTDEVVGRPPEIPIAQSPGPQRGGPVRPKVARKARLPKRPRSHRPSPPWRMGLFEGGLVTNYVTRRGFRLGRHRRGRKPWGARWGCVVEGSPVDGAEGHTPESNWYGGAGYGNTNDPIFPTPRPC